MSKLASMVVSQARVWLGRKEADGSHKAIIDIYNEQKALPRGYKVKYTDSWCATFVSAISVKLGYTDIIPTECGCGEMIKLFQKIGAWEENDAHVPKPGDIIFYDWQDNGIGDNRGWSDHVGIVEKVNGNTITIIEGNYGDAVARRTIQVNEKCIRGYGVPKYDAESVKQVEDNGVVAGKKVVLNNTKRYSSESATSHYDTKSGTYYLWDNVVKNGRIRITNSPARVGVKGQVTCWVNVADLNLAEQKPQTPARTEPVQQSIKAGDVFNLKAVPVFNSESGTCIGTRTGKYYAWENEPTNRTRIKMTNSLTRVGKKGQVSFFVEVKDLK